MAGGTQVASLPDDLPVSAFDYPLTDAHIAQRPVEPRDASRLLHLRPDGGLEDRAFAELPELLAPGDLLVVNDTRVRAARLRGRRPGGGAAEILVTTRLPDGRYACLVRPARRLPPDTRVEVGEGLAAVVGEPCGSHSGARAVRFEVEGGDVDAAIEACGTVPLPPYIRERLSDPHRYQTLFSQHTPPESAAAPTAGLHFTPAVLDGLRVRGVAVATVRLEVGLATFTPIRSETISGHVMHDEAFELPEATATAIQAARARGGRVIAVGTTTARVLETMAAGAGEVAPGRGVTRLYLRPGVAVRCIDGLLTNFHQPRSSLLVLLAAVTGDDAWRRAYDHALATGYRFLSFGDCMLCWVDRRPPPAS